MYLLLHFQLTRMKWMYSLPTDSQCTNVAEIIQLINLIKGRN